MKIENDLADEQEDDEPRTECDNCGEPLFDRVCRNYLCVCSPYYKAN